jgi:hypothetical protein
LTIIYQESRSLEEKINPKQFFQIVGDIVRQKLKIRVINKDNNRAYTIGIDQTAAPNGKTMRQVEIEYIGIEPDAFCSVLRKSIETKDSNIIELEIATKIQCIEKAVVDVCCQANITLKPTRKTKSKWLRGMHRIIKLAH